MKFLIAILGLLVVFGLAYIASNGKKQIRYRPLAVMIVLQIILAYFLLNTAAGTFLVGKFSTAFKALLDYANEGIAFVFGDLVTIGAEGGSRPVLPHRADADCGHLCLDWDITVYPNLAFCYKIYWSGIKQNQRNGQTGII